MAEQNRVRPLPQLLVNRKLTSSGRETRSSSWLPVASTSFVGRERDLVAVRERLLQSEVHGNVNGEGLRELTHMSHLDIATLVGASRQWVTQTLSALDKRGLIRTGHRRITVVDPRAPRRATLLGMDTVGE